MTPARRNELRSIMKRAHWQRRERPEVSFAEHLRSSWEHHKTLARFYAGASIAPGRLVHLRSPITSPVEREVRCSNSRYAYVEARDRSRLTTQLGS